MLHVFCTNGHILSRYCSVSSNFSFSIRAGHGAKGDPWRNYMGKGKLEIGGMVIRISVQYRDAAGCNIATDQAKLVHFSVRIARRTLVFFKLKIPEFQLCLFPNCCSVFCELATLSRFEILYLKIT